MASDFKIDFR